jgi:hypothetical protein
MLVFDAVNPDVMTITQEKKSLGSITSWKMAVNCLFPQHWSSFSRRLLTKEGSIRGFAVVAAPSRDGKECCWTFWIRRLRA